jgi:hypothetical protein
MAYRPLRLCSNGGGIEAVPDVPRTLDLVQLRRELEAQGIEVIDARVMLIAATDPEVTISRSGRLLFKTPDETRAAMLFERLRGLGALQARRARPR